MSPSVSVCPSNEWIFSSSAAGRLQLTQNKSLLVSGRKWNTAHLLDIADDLLSLAAAVLRLEVNIEEMLQTFPLQTQLAILGAWQMTYVLNLAQKSRDQQHSVSDIWSDQMSVVMTSQRCTDRQGCLTLPGTLQFQGRPRSYHIKHALMPPTNSVSKLKLQRQIFLSGISLCISSIFPWVK